MKYYFLALGTALLVCVGCAIDGQQMVDRREYVAPPPQMMAHPGPMVDGPGPAVMMPLTPPGMEMMPPRSSEIRFLGPSGMHVGWQVGETFANNQLVAPGRYGFRQGFTYRLKINNIPGPGREGLTLYPTLQVYPGHPSTDAYLAHTDIPMLITDEDLDQVESNNFVTKVVYLPDPKFQELAIAGVETLVSTKLEPGVDPVSEADRRGTIMAVLRIGNMDLENPNGMGGPSIQQTAYTVDGFQGQLIEPAPIGPAGTENGVPPVQMMGAPGYPGGPAMNPYVAGGGAMPTWGNPITATPIGLPGAASLPLGGPASLKSYTMRNNTRMDIPKPVEHFLVDVEHQPGYSLPKPVKHVSITEKHPLYAPGEVSYPAWSNPQGQAVPANDGHFGH
jgi:hypothetical protein